jgi:protocatechuate 3,4-dioxygenase beta subunit
MLRRIVPLGGLLAVLAVHAIRAEGIGIEGRVLVAAGAPLPQAEVSLRALAEPLTGEVPAATVVAERPRPRTLTNAEGRFRLEAPGAGLWVVHVEAAGFVPLETRLQPLLEPIVLADARLEADSGLEVELRDERGPVAGARVIARTDRSRFASSLDVWSPPEREGHTDAQGRVVLSRGDRERLTVTASAAGYVLAQRDGVVGGAKLALARGVERSLSVRATDGSPIADATLSLGPQRHPYATTGQDGSVRVTLPATGETQVTVEAGDGRRLATTLAAGPVEERQRPVVLTLPDLVALPGRLVDADSRRAIAGGLVWDGNDPREAAVSDGAGGFVLRGPRGTRLEVMGGAAGYLRSSPTSLQLEDDGRAGPTLALEPAAAIEGQVVDAAGEAIAGAELTVSVKQPPGGIRIEIGAPRAQIRNLSDQSGRFRLGPLDPAGRYAVAAAAGGFAPAELPIAGLEPHRTKTGVQVVLTPGQAVLGRVIDEAGKPLREASIVLKPARDAGGRGMMRLMQPEPGLSFEVVTDDGGGFRITGVPKGRFDLTVRRRGFAPTRVAAIEIAGVGEPTDAGEITLVPGERVSGVVADPAGRPIEGVEVRVQESGPGMVMMMGHEPGPQEEADAVTDPGGWFLVEDLSRGEKLELGFERTGYVSTRSKGIELPRSEPVEVVLEPASTVSGIVLSEEGDPIAGAAIDLARRETVELGGNVMIMMTMESDTSDAEGRFRFTEQRPGSIALTAVASGYQERKLDNVEVPQGRDLEGLELTLPSGAIVVGRVFGPDERPLIGARVAKVAGESSMVRMGGDNVTDGDGRYRLEGLAPGVVSIEAEHPDWPRTVRDAELEPGLNTVDLRFEGGQPVSGRLVGTGGRAVADADVRLSAPGRYWGGPATRSRADGTFEIPGVADGEYRLWVEAEGFAPHSENDTIRVAGEPVTGLEVRLDEGAAVTGRVLGLDREDYARVTVNAEGASASVFGGAPVDREGNFRLEHVRPGTYAVVASLADSGRSASEQLTIEDGQTEARVDLQFEPGLTLDGLVLQGEAPVLGASVFVEGLSLDKTGWGDTDHQGRFSIDGLAPGSYRANVRDFTSGLAYDEPFELATSREITLRVPTAFVAGRVVDGADRSPLSGVTLTLVPNDPSQEGRLPLHAAASDMQGRFRIASIADGDWRLTASKGAMPRLRGRSRCSSIARPTASS